MFTRAFLVIAICIASLVGASKGHGEPHGIKPFIPKPHIPVAPPRKCYSHLKYCCWHFKACGFKFAAFSKKEICPVKKCEKKCYKINCKLVKKYVYKKVCYKKTVFKKSCYKHPWLAKVCVNKPHKVDICKYIKVPKHHYNCKKVCKDVCFIKKVNCIIKKKLKFFKFCPVLKCYAGKFKGDHLKPEDYYTKKGNVVFKKVFIVKHGHAAK